MKNKKMKLTRVTIPKHARDWHPDLKLSSFFFVNFRFQSLIQSETKTLVEWNALTILKSQYWPLENCQCKTLTTAKLQFHHKLLTLFICFCRTVLLGAAGLAACINQEVVKYFWPKDVKYFWPGADNCHPGHHFWPPTTGYGIISQDTRYVVCWPTR